MNARRRADLGADLVELGYDTLFLHLDRSPLEKLWKRPGGPAQFRALVNDQSADTRARFLAAEVLWEREPLAPPDAADLGHVYAAALRSVVTTVANPWGLPGAGDGVVAQHVLALHDSSGAARALRPLLEDDNRLDYIGSKEASEGNRFHYRVCDVAAELVAQLLHLPYDVVVDPAARDIAIAALRIAADAVLSRGGQR